MAVPIAIPRPIIRTQPRRASYAARRQVIARLFVAPLLLLSIFGLLLPTLGGVAFSFTDWSGLGPLNFVGLDNYVKLASDPYYLSALTNNLKWLSLFLTVPILMGLLGAALLAPIKRGQMVFRIAFFIPYILPSLVNVSIWRSLMHPQLGVGAVLAEHGITFLNYNFLGDTKIALYAIAFMDNWHWWGFLVVVYLAAMQNIDPELIEVARLEGANRWQEFRHVTLPGIQPTLVFTLLMTVIWSVLSFDYVWATAQGGPAQSSHLLSTYAYNNAFLKLNVGYASAIGVTMMAICGSVILVFAYLRRRGWEI